HDQVGNRALGERLTALVSSGIRKVLAAILLLAPETPLLFMGQEMDEDAPFQFFTDFGDPVIKRAVTEGRREEFKDFAGFEKEVPDPQDPATFERSKLRWSTAPERLEMLKWYQQLIALRRAVYADARRNCEAKLVDGGIEMKISREKPSL